ncbi:MAG: acetolactate synthase [Clostridia bacterium]
MYVKQISVFIENTPGRLAHFTKLLGDNHIDLVSLSVADTTHFGILRGIVADYEQAVKLISDNGYTVKLTDVLAVNVADRPGGLADVLKVLAENEIGVEYLYSFVRNAGDHALIIFRVDKLDEAADVLTQAGIKLLSQDEVRGL